MTSCTQLHHGTLRPLFSKLLALPGSLSGQYHLVYSPLVCKNQLGMNLNGQDWNDVVIRKKKPTTAQASTSQAVNAARATGAEVETKKKFAAGKNLNTVGGKDAAKLDRETEELHHDRVPQELKKRIMSARTDKKLTQAQLAQLINEKPQVIQEYESGKAIPSGAILSKLSRVLGVQLSAKAGKK